MDHHDPCHYVLLPVLSRKSVLTDTTEVCREGRRPGMAGREIESDCLDLSNPSVGYAVVYGREAEFGDVMELTHSVYQVQWMSFVPGTRCF